MKYLLTAALIFVIYLIWRAGRKSNSTPPGPGKPATPQDMLSCSLCAVHVPAIDAVQGRLGAYCCVQHRDEKEN